MDVVAELQKFFGFSQFRTGQQAVVETSIAGKDLVAIFPTGTGKSVCFQLAGVIRGGLTIVISPLISLMKDQVEHLVDKGIAAAYLGSHLSPSEKQRIRTRLAMHELQFLYVSPEKLQDKQLRKLIEHQVNFIVVDEAHCVSAWGHDFRPPYQQIGLWISTLPRRPPIAAFTATATTLVVEDICQSLQLKTPARFQTSLVRPNLQYFLYPLVTQHRQLLFVRNWLESHLTQSGIVYAGTREGVVQWTSYLAHFYQNVAAYHAGIPPDRRINIQQQFIENKVKILVATSAFGMGVDKPDVDWVLHVGLSSDLESYLQEAGRAGRGGQVSDCGVIISQQTWQRYLEQLELDWPHPQLIISVAKTIAKQARMTPLSTPKLAESIQEYIESKNLEYLLRKLIKWGWIDRKKKDIQWKAVSRVAFTHYQQQYQKKYQQALALERMLTNTTCFTQQYLRYFDQQPLSEPCELCSHCQPKLLLRSWCSRTTLPQTQALLPRFLLGLA